MVSHLTQLVRDQFDKNPEVELDKLYEILMTHTEIQFTPADLKHRVRAIIYSMKLHNKIKRIAPCTYTKI